MPRSAKPTRVAAPPASPPDHLFVGTSGWAYPSWKPGFYPKPTPARSFLTYYASQLNSTEVNYSFRKLPTSSQLQGWLAETPPGFRFSFKAPQRITHFARLRDCEQAVTELFQSVQPACDVGRLGTLLFQLPPNFKADRERLARFLDLTAVRQQDAPRLAFEFRHPSWFEEEIFALLRDANAALCVAESELLKTPDVATASFRYYRLRRPGGYGAAALKRMASDFTSLANDADVFVYFKHEEEPTGALQAHALLMQTTKRTRSTAAKGSP